MGVDRTDYLMWGAKVDPEKVGDNYDEYEAEMDGTPSKRFDLVYDVRSGEYAIAGKIISESDPRHGARFQQISPEQMQWDASVVSAVRSEFPDAHEFGMFLFSHFS